MIFVLVAAAAASAAPTAPAKPPVVKVAEVRSDRSCELVAAGWYWLLIECQKEFPKLRTALQSALLDSGKVRLSTSRGGRDSAPADFVVSASVTGLGSSVERASAADYCVASNRLEGRMDYRVRGPSGAVLYGGSALKTVEVGSHAVAGASSCSVGAMDPASYEQLEREIALTTARAILFRIVPLRVTASDAEGITLNYGAPYLRLGDAIDVADGRGRRARFRVTSSTGTIAFAEPDGERREIAAGSTATYVEPDDPANNARRFRKVELP